MSPEYGLSTSEDLADTARVFEDRGQRVLSMEMDVRNESAVESVVERAIGEFGKIDVLANNVGMVTMGSLLDMNERTWEELVHIVIKGV